MGLIIVEFIGFPASGKTTIAKEVYRTLVEEGVQVIYPLYDLYKKPWLTRNIIKAKDVTTYFVNNIGKSMRFIRLLSKYGQIKKRDYIRLTFNNLFLISIQTKYNKSKVICVFDEGTLHHIWALSLGACRSIELQKLLEFYTFPDIIVHVKVKTSILEERYKQRMGSNELNIEERHLYVIKNADVENKKLKICCWK